MLPRKFFVTLYFIFSTTFTLSFSATFNAGTYAINYDTATGTYDVLFNNYKVITAAYAAANYGHDMVQSILQ